MFKGYKILMFWVLGTPATLFSQQLSLQVLVPLAGLASERSVSYSQTVGEAIVEIAGCSGYVFTQGFQQPGFKVIKDDTWPLGTGVNVYPNPVSDFVTIELWGESAMSFRIDFINITGNTVMSERKVFNGQFWNKDPLKVEGLIRGFYLIRVFSETGILNRTFKIEKL